MRAVVVLAVAAGAALIGGCGAGGRGSDGGTRHDLGGGEMSGGAGSLVSAGSYGALVLTPDDVALVTDEQSTLWAVPLAGGARAMLEPNVSMTARAGDAVFVWHDGGAPGASALAVFAAGKLRELDGATPDEARFAGAVASDGTHLAYLGNLAGGRADLFVQRSDGSGGRALAQRFDVGPSCTPAVGLVAGRVVVSRCFAGSFVVVAYDAESGAGTTLLAPSAPGFAAVPSRAAVVVANVMNGSSLVPVAGGNPTPLSGDVKRSLPLADGSAVVQLTAGGALVRARLPDGGLTSLAASGAGDVEALSSDGAWVLYSGAPDAATGDAALYLASAAKSGTASAINTEKTTPPLVGGGFSDDAAFTIYITDADNNGYGPLRVRPLAGGIGASRTLSLASTGFRPAGGARLVYADRYTPAAGAGHVALQLVDLAAAAAPSLLAADAGPAWLLTDDKKTLAFLVGGGNAPGLYAAVLP